MVLSSPIVGAYRKYFTEEESYADRHQLEVAQGEITRQLELAQGLGGPVGVKNTELPPPCGNRCLRLRESLHGWCSPVFDSVSRLPMAFSCSGSVSRSASSSSPPGEKSCSRPRAALLPLGKRAARGRGGLVDPGATSVQNY